MGDLNIPELKDKAMTTVKNSKDQTTTFYVSDGSAPESFGVAIFHEYVFNSQSYLIKAIESSYQAQPDTAIIKEVKLSKDKNYMIIHLLKEHTFSLKNREIHEFVVFKIQSRRLNTVKAFLDLDKNTELYFDVTNEVPPFNLPYLYVIKGINIIVLSLITGQIVRKYDYSETIANNVSKAFLFDRISIKHYQNMFLTSKKFDSILLLKVKNKMNSERFNDQNFEKLEIYLTNMESQKNLKSTFFCKIQELVHKFVAENFKKKEKNKNLKLKSFFSKNDLIKKIDSIIEDMEKNSVGLLFINKMHEEFIKAKRENDLKKIEETEKNLKEVKLNHLLESLMKIILNNKNEALKILDRVTALLKGINARKTKKFRKLYDYNNDFIQMKKEDTKGFKNKFENFWEELKMEEKSLKEIYIPIEEEKLGDFIEKMIDFFQNDISPNFLSIELVWREIITFSQYKQLDGLENIYRETVVKKCIPFEVIDGDLLHMPVEFLKKIFVNMNNKTLVISITGPQSSGKSTLLNFLFGCDFSTSTGRCTKGIYGTFMEVANLPKDSAFDSILLLDTEGLGSTAKTNDDISGRNEFDRQMVLFCLGVSDVIIINVKGDLDKPMKDILNVCVNSISLLNNNKLHQCSNYDKENIENMAEIFLVLNQNPDTCIDNHQHSIDSIFNDFNGSSINDFKVDKDNVKIMPNAFDVKDHKSFLNEITIKTPTDKFANLSNELCQSIFKLINSPDKKPKNLGKTLKERFQDMALFWDLIRNFPFLSKFKSIDYQKKEEEILEWIHELSNRLYLDKTEFISGFLEENNKNENVIDLSKQNEKKHKNEFTEKFSNYPDFLVKDFEEKELILHLTVPNYDQIRHYLTVFKQKEKKFLEKDNIFGELRLKNLAKELRDSNIKIDQNELNVKFENEWERILKDDYLPEKNRQEVSKQLFKVISSYYNFKVTNNLPKVFWNKDIEQKSKLPDSWQDQIQKQNLFESISCDLNCKLKSCNRFFQNDLNEPLKNYFEISKYYSQIQKIKKITFISFKDFYNSIKFNEILNKVCKNLISNKNSYKKNFEEVLTQINETLNSIFGENLNYAYFEEIINSYRTKFIQNYTGLKKIKDFYSIHKLLSSFKKLENCIFSQGNNISLMEINDKIKLIQSNELFKQIEIQEEVNGSIFITRGKFLLHLVTSVIDWKKVEKKVIKDQQEIFLSNAISPETGIIFEDCKKLKISLNENKFNQILINFIKKEDPEILDFKPDYSLLFKKKDLLNYCLKLSQLKYIDICKLKKLINSQINSNNISNKENLILEERNLIIRELKKENLNKTWLPKKITDYEEDFNEKNVNSSQKMLDLKILLKKEFKFELFIEDFKGKINKILKEYKEYQNQEIYEKVKKEVKDFILIANEDLIQISCTFSFEMIGFLHLFALHLIWLYFEQLNWENLKKPYDNMAIEKESQRNFFNFMATIDFKQIDIKNVKFFMEKLEEFISESLINNIQIEFFEEYKTENKKIINRNNIINDLKRKKFYLNEQNIISNNNEAIDYLMNPKKFIDIEYIKFYENFNKNLKNKEIKYQNSIQSFIKEIQKIFENLLEEISESYKKEEDCYIENLLHFENLAKDKPEKEVIISNEFQKICKTFYNSIIDLVINNNLKNEEKILLIQENYWRNFHWVRKSIISILGYQNMEIKGFYLSN